MDRTIIYLWKWFHLIQKMKKIKETGGLGFHCNASQLHLFTFTALSDNNQSLPFAHQLPIIINDSAALTNNSLSGRNWAEGWPRFMSTVPSPLFSPFLQEVEWVMWTRWNVMLAQPQNWAWGEKWRVAGRKLLSGQEQMGEHEKFGLSVGQTQPTASKAGLWSYLSVELVLKGNAGTFTSGQKLVQIHLLFSVMTDLYSGSWLFGCQENTEDRLSVTKSLD